MNGSNTPSTGSFCMGVFIVLYLIVFIGHEVWSFRQPNNALLRAVRQGYTGTVVSLLDKGVNPNCQDDDGETPLIIVFSNSKPNYRMARLLLERGANPNLRSISLDNTPLTEAIESVKFNKNSEAVEFLLQNGANPEIRVEKGTLPLTLAIYSRQANTVKALLSAGANPNELDNFTPLETALLCRHPEIAQILLDSGADINGRDKTGATALISHTALGRDDAVRFLLEHGAGVNLRLEGFTALTVAKRDNNTELVSLLQSAGAVE